MKKTLLIAALLLFAASRTTHASLGVGAKSLGMAEAYTAMANDETAIYWNPSLLLDADKNFSISLPQLGITFKSNLDRDDVQDLSGDEIETLGNANLDMAVSGMIGGHQNQFGLAALMDAQGHVVVNGGDLDKMEKLFNIIETYDNGAAPVTTYAQALAAAGITPGTTLTSSVNSNFVAQVGGAFSYAMKFKDINFGANIKILKGQLYAAQVSSSYAVPAAGLATDFTVANANAVTSGSIIDADGNGFALDISASKKMGDVLFIKDSKVGVMVRNAYGRLSVSGTSTPYAFVETVAGSGNYTLQENTALAKPYSTDLSLSPEIAVGIAGSIPAGITLAGDLKLDTDGGDFGASIGAEKQLFNLLKLRAGINRSAITEEFNFALGLGLDLKVVNLDLAYGFGGGDGTNETVGIGLRAAF